MGGEAGIPDAGASTLTELLGSPPWSDEYPGKNERLRALEENSCVQSGGKAGRVGETCRMTFDCKGRLACIDNVCTWGPGSGMNSHRECQESPGCKTDGGCWLKWEWRCDYAGFASGCRATESSCQASTNCKENGACVSQDGICQPSEEGCKASKECVEHGVCGLSVDDYERPLCVGTEEGCANSQVCRKSGLCGVRVSGRHHGGFTCALNRSGCRESERCTKTGECYWLQWTRTQVEVGGSAPDPASPSLVFEDSNNWNLYQECLSKNGRPHVFDGECNTASAAKDELRKAQSGARDQYGYTGVPSSVVYRTDSFRYNCAANAKYTWSLTCEAPAGMSCPTP